MNQWIYHFDVAAINWFSQIRARTMQFQRLMLNLVESKQTSHNNSWLAIVRICESYRCFFKIWFFSFVHTRYNEIDVEAVLNKMRSRFSMLILLVSSANSGSIDINLFFVFESSFTLMSNLTHFQTPQHEWLNTSNWCGFHRWLNRNLIATSTSINSRFNDSRHQIHWILSLNSSFASVVRSCLIHNSNGLQLHQLFTMT